MRSGDSANRSAADHEALVTKAVAGDRAALTILLTRAQPDLRERIAARVPLDLQSVVGVDDVVQQALVGAFRDVSRFTPRGPGSFERWLSTIATHALRNAIKARRRVKRGGRMTPLAPRNSDESLVDLFDVIAAPGRTASRSIARREASAAMRSAMNKLPDDYRQALWDVCVEGKPVADVAAGMGRTIRAIHNLCHKGKQKLAELLGEDPRL